MKKLYLVIIISLISISLTAQSFTMIAGTPFEDVCGIIATTDIDNDNDPDVLLAATLYTNIGNGFYEGGLLIPDNWLEIYDIDFADVDDDDDQDVLISWMSAESGKSEEENMHTKLFSNDGNGSFSANPTFEIAGIKCGSVDFVDIENDGDQDALITGFTYGTSGSELYPETLLYLNDGNGVFTESMEDNFADIGFSDVAFADVDNDNDLDVLMSGFDGINAISILYINDGTGVFTESIGNSLIGVGDCSIAFGDIDNDNDPDILISGWSGIVGLSYTQLYTNDGSGLFEFVEDAPFVVVGAGAVAFSDVDNDNDLDVLITGYNGIETHAKLYTNDGYGEFQLLYETPFVGASRSSIAFTDFDNDGDQDVIISGFSDWLFGVPLNPQTNLYMNNTISTGLPDINPLFNSVIISPNPNQGWVTIKGDDINDLSVKVYSLGGQLIYQKENISDPMFQFELTANAGVYILELSTQNQQQRYKLIKQ